ncbi:hypothetical protein G5S34_16225 [Herbaspirillum frisingense]|uniref:toxin co-regulated pilus biosynthesis Q family protein n=1 Tax=Herbaspirillum frisingense TaxID=92645 RepID=UPI0015FEE7A9|nr:toxin co-regulated pilus biosynthesis Q family protein [Herbaspirillum frisingense]QNB08156.1 hypothetical protein G5S34_16225 [Herbaspirillum frisingense]
MNKVTVHLIHRTRPCGLPRRWLRAFALLAVCIPVHAQQVGRHDPTNAEALAATGRASAWLPKGAAIEPELTNGIGVSAIDHHPDPGVQQWQVRRADVSVRRMLQRWGQEAGWQLVWDAPRDFPIETELQLSGRIEQVVSAVVESLATTDYPVQARINSELRIIRIGGYLEGKAR